MVQKPAIPYVVIDGRSGSPVYVQIMDQVRARVTDGSLPPGTPVPSVRQLAADLEINPNTVAKAYTLLESEGIVSTRARRGTFIAETAHRRATESIDRRLGEALDRFVTETAHLAVDGEEILAALGRRLRDGAHDPAGGDSS